MFPCSTLLRSGCSQLSVNMVPQSHQPQTHRGSRLLGSNYLGLPDPSHWGTSRAQAQGRQKALGLRRVLKPAQPNSGLDNPRPGLRSELSAQGRACGPLLGMTKILFIQKHCELQPQEIFLVFFLGLVSFLLFHVFIPLKWSRAQQKWIIKCVTGWGNILFNFNLYVLYAV